MAPAPLVLKTAIGAYPHVAALRSGAVASTLLTFDFADIRPINRAFAPMVREGRFDLCEMAVATALQAKAFGKPLVLLPVAMAARFQETALLCRADGPIHGPRDLKGKRLGVRAYAQTTAMWLRGILDEAHGVRPEDIRWVTFEGAHVAEYRDPPFAERAREGADLTQMLRAGELDAIIVGADPPDDAAFRTVFADTHAAGGAFAVRHGFMPVNHLLVLRTPLAAERPEIAGELVAMFKSARQAAGGEVAATAGRDAVGPSVALALRFCAAQGLLPGGLTPDGVWS